MYIAAEATLARYKADVIAQEAAEGFVREAEQQAIYEGAEGYDYLRHEPLPAASEQPPPPPSPTMQRLRRKCALARERAEAARRAFDEAAAHDRHMKHELSVANAQKNGAMKPK